jgi:hypothetical protein
MYKIRVFDELVYDNDPNLTNVLISAGWKIWRIDFTRAFRLQHALKDPKDLVRCDGQLLAGLRALNGDELAAKTKPYLTKEEVQAVMVRRDIVVRSSTQRSRKRARKKSCTNHLLSRRCAWLGAESHTSDLR